MIIYCRAELGVEQVWVVLSGILHQRLQPAVACCRGSCSLAPRTWWPCDGSWSWVRMSRWIVQGGVASDERLQHWVTYIGDFWNTKAEYVAWVCFLVGRYMAAFCGGPWQERDDYAACGLSQWKLLDGAGRTMCEYISMVRKAILWKLFSFCLLYLFLSNNHISNKIGWSQWLR